MYIYKNKDVTYVVSHYYMNSSKLKKYTKNNELNSASVACRVLGSGLIYYVIRISEREQREIKQKKILNSQTFYKFEE